MPQDRNHFLNFHSPRQFATIMIVPQIGHDVNVFIRKKIQADSSKRFFGSIVTTYISLFENHILYPDYKYRNANKEPEFFGCYLLSYIK